MNLDEFKAQAEAAEADCKTAQEDDGLLLPPWTSIQSTEPPSRNPVLLDGVVRLGHVMLLAGKGKIGKSWSAIELCVSVATGLDNWFGIPLKSSGACLFIDPELDPKSLDNRFNKVCEAMDADTKTVDSKVAKWSLRGVSGANINSIIHDLAKRCESEKFALVVIDSCSCFVEGDENSSVDVRAFSSKVLQIAGLTGGCVVLIHHFGKAKDGDRAAADRARGSSVWLDFPDAALTLTEILPPSGEPSDYLQDGEYACILESGGVREFPRMEPKRLIFGYPIHRVDEYGITESWKPNSSQRDGAKKTNEMKQVRSKLKAEKICSALLSHYYENGIGEEGLILKKAAEAANVDSRTLESAIDGSDYFELISVTKRKRYVRPKHPPQEQPEELPLEK